MTEERASDKVEHPIAVGTLQHCRHAGRPGLRAIDNLVKLTSNLKTAHTFVLVGSAVINTHAHRDIPISQRVRAGGIPYSNFGARRLGPDPGVLQKVYSKQSDE